MANQIEREAWVKQDKLKNPIHYVRGTDLLPIVFHFRDFKIPSGATARVFVAKPDGNAVYDSATIDGNDVTVDVTEQMFLVLGMTLMQISIFDGEEELVSFAQPVMVEQNLKAGDLPESTTDVAFLDDAIEQANRAVNTATTAASQAAQAVKNANQAIADANEAISDLNAQIASLNTNFASLSNNVSISQLQTKAKTLVGAVNELNGKSWLLQGGTAIPSSSDMDDYKTIGNYYCNQNTIAPTLLNSPFERPFTMKVGYSTGSSYPYQLYREFNTGIVAYRYFSTDSSKWTEFVYFSDDETLFAGKAINSGDDLNDYTTPGIYYSPASGVSGTLINIPEESAKTSGFSLLVLPTSPSGPDGRVSQTIIKGAEASAIYTRSESSSGWRPWYKYAGEKIEA